MKRRADFWLMVVAAIVVAIWGETFVSSKILLSHGLMPADIFLYRITIAYVGMVCLSHRRLWSGSWRDELLLVFSGMCGGSVYFLTENMALKLSTASNVAIFVGTTPIVTAILLACFYRDERLTRRQIFGSMVAFVGLIFVVLNGRLILHLNPAGDILAFSASICWGIYSLCIKPLSKRYDARFITRKVFGYGLLTIIPWLIFVEPLNHRADILGNPVVWGNIIYLGLVASLGCFLVWNEVAPRIGMVRSTNIVYTQCFVTMVISHFVLDEQITAMAVGGTLILIFGMMLMSKKKQAVG